MKKIFKLCAVLLISIVAICGYSFLTNKRYYTKWEISKKYPDTAQISWAKFQWTNDTLFGKYCERTTMQIPGKIEGLPYNFTFQFDLGSDVTGVYENNISSFYKTNPGLQDRISRLRSPLQFWYNKKGVKDLALLFGNYKANNKISFLFSNYGEQLKINNQNLNDTFHIGTIGADIFQGKVLIIDYPNKQFAICDTVPNIYKRYLSNIDLDKAGRVLLPMQLNGKTYTTLFDNGSSLFPLLTTDDKINSFSTLPAIDTFKGYAWGKAFTAIGRPINDSFTIAGHHFYRSTIYSDLRKENRTDKFDAITGNILFWHNTIIIDFKNRKFGVL